MTKLQKEIIIVFALISLWGYLWVNVPKWTETKKLTQPEKELEIASEGNFISKIQQRKQEIVEYSAFSERDPLKASFYVDEEFIRPGLFPQSPRIEQKAVKQLPPMTVQGVVWGTDRSSAIINDQVVKEGDVISGAKITEISSKGVNLFYEGNEFLLPIPSIKNK